MSKSGGRPKGEFISSEVDFSWESMASCRLTEKISFFPEEGDIKGLRKATAVCAGCVVVDQCLQFALETNQKHGVWGGMGEKERKSHRRRWLAEKRRNET